MNRSFFTFSLVAILLGITLGIAYAGGNPVPVDPLEQGKGAYGAVENGQWLLAFAFASMLLGSAARWLGGKKWGFLATEAGGYAMAVFTGLGAFGAGYIEAGAFSIPLVMTALITMLSAMGMHGPAKSVVKKSTGAES